MMTAEALTQRDLPARERERSRAVAVDGVRKTYALRPVLRGVSFEVATGQCTVVLGANGAGKTTLLRILATLTKPTGGSVTVAGHNALGEPQAVRRSVGYLGHMPLLYPELTARENLCFFARMYGLEQADGRVEELLERVGMAARAGDRAATFSRGQAQRVGLARAVLHDPKVLLLDEPDTGLDEEALALLAAVVREYSTAGRTAIFTTHSIERGLAWADAAVVLAGGRAAYRGPARDLEPALVRALYAGRGAAR